MRKNAITLPDGTLYLETKFRIAEFRKNPENRIETELTFIDNCMAVVKAYAMSGEKRISEAYAMRHVSVEERFLEAAETAAIGRALSDAGYNLFLEELKDQNPLEKAITLNDGSPYLEVNYRIAWMRREHPEWRIKKKLLSFTNSFAVMQCVVTDEAGNVLSTSHARRQYQEDEMKRQFLECAETAAVGRALSLLGYDLLAAKDLNDSGLAEAPLKPGKTDFAHQPAEASETELPMQTEMAGTEPVMRDSQMGNLPELSRSEIPKVFNDTNYMPDFDANAFMPENVAENGEEILFFQEDETIPMVKMKSERQNNSAENYKIPFGIYMGQSLVEVFQKDRAFVEMLVKNYKGDLELVNAAKLLLQQN